MKFLRSLFGIVLLITTHIFSAQALVLAGKVTDAATGEPLIGATLTIPELRIATSTNQNGEYRFARIPTKGRFVIEVKYIGYRTLNQTVDFSSPTPMHFELEPSVIEVHEVVVTGTLSSTDNRTNSTSVSTISKAELLSRPSNNIIDAISRVPGVSQITTGAGVSKPVIRGLSYNRVITLADGAKQEGQQWGDEHGIELDQYNTDRVEILRGAASLQYGSDALGGVINLLDPLPSPLGEIRGEILSNYSTNNGLTGNSAMLQGNNNDFVWRARGSYKSAFSYNTPAGRINNSGFNERNLAAQLGFNKSWGYTHLNLSSFHNQLGIPESTSGEEEPNFITGSKERKMEIPFQDIRHYKIALNNQFIFGKGRLRSTLAFQNNQRKELEMSNTDPSLFFDLKTYSYDLKYYFEESKGWEPVIGISGAFQNSVNRAEELLIPDYQSQDAGGFAYLKKSWKASTVNAGIRFDYRNISGDEMSQDNELKFQPFSNTFSNLSGAIGFTHDISESLNFKANVGSAFRAPNIAELSSNGVHEGTYRYEIGSADLDPERSLSADASLEYHTTKVDAHFSVYNNYINNYIYSRRLNGETIEAEGELLPVYHYVQNNANLYGTEIGLTVHPTSLLHLENSFAITRGINRATKNDLPFIPAPVLRNELRFEPRLKSRGLKSPYISIGLDNFFPQNNYDPEFETKTAGYTLLNASLGGTIQLKKQQLRLYISGNNLLNKAYVDHLNRLKYEGILNQGTNVSFGFQMPLVFKQ